MSKSFKEVMKKVDLEMLVLQKAALVDLRARFEPDDFEGDTLEGVINFLDFLQDTAEEEGLITAQKIKELYWDNFGIEV
jgi:hypothetical protein